MGPLKALNDTKLIINDEGVTHAQLGPIWYHLEPSDIPYSPNQFLDRHYFAASYIRAALYLT